PPECVRLHPAWEVARVLAGRMGGEVVGDYAWERTERGFDATVARTLTTSLSAVYGYEHAALTTFARAKRLGLKIYYDMPAPHHQLTSQVLEDEYEKYPALRTEHYVHTRPLTAKRNVRRDEELSLADAVVCASKLTESSLIAVGVPSERILRVPYGMPPPVADASVTRRGPVRFLYAGTLSVRKGVHYIIEACKRIQLRDGAELWMVGANTLPAALLESLPSGVRIMGSRPRPELLQLYQQADLLLFPTLLDGFGMVLTEA